MSTFQPWEADSAKAIDEVRNITTSPKFWENVSVYYAEENHETTIILDNVSCIKSICKLYQSLWSAKFIGLQSNSSKMNRSKHFNQQ